MADEATADRIMLVERPWMQSELALDPPDELPLNGGEVDKADEKEAAFVNQYADYINSLFNKASCQLINSYFAFQIRCIGMLS